MRIMLPVLICGILSTAPALAQAPAPAPAPDPVSTLVGRLDLEKYKATIKGLTQFGDRRQGTDRNRAAVDWIEAQLKSYGCTDRAHQVRLRPAAAERPRRRPRRAARTGAGGQGGGRPRGDRARRPASTPIRLKQPDAKLRALNTQPTTPGPREEVYLHEGRHDASRRDVHRRRPHGRPRLGRGGERRRLGHRARDGAGARLQQPGRADRSLDPLRALEQRGDRARTARAPTSRSAQALQGKENPPGSGKYPEPKWLGMIQHDMMMFDHGMPRADGTMQPGAAARGRREHRVPGDVEVGRRTRRSSRGSSQAANEKYATDYPAAVGRT